MLPDGHTEDNSSSALDRSLSSASLHSWNLFRKRVPSRVPLEPPPARAYHSRFLQNSRNDERGKISGTSRSNAKVRKEDERWSRRGSYQKVREGGRHNGNLVDSSSSSVPLGPTPDIEASHRRHAEGRASETTDNLAWPSATIAEHHYGNTDFREQYHYRLHIPRQLRADQDLGALTSSATVESFRRSASRNAEQRRPFLEHRTPFLGNLHGLTYQHEAAMEARDRLDERLRSRAFRNHSDEDARRYDEIWETFRQDHLAALGLHIDFGSSSEKVLQPTGLSKALIMHLHREVFVPKITVRDKTVGDMKFEPSEQDDCSVCLEHFVSGQLLICLPCKHRFHPDCVTPWLETHGQCPYCRAKISSKGTGETSSSDGSGTGYATAPNERIAVAWLETTNSELSRLAIR